MEFEDENSELRALNSNIRDPRVNDGDWKAMVYSLNCNIRDPKVNNSEWRAMSKGGLRLCFRYHPIFTNLQTKATPNILRKGTTMLCPDITVHPSQEFICNFPFKN